MSAMFFNIDSLYCGISKGVFESRTTLSINELGILEDYHDDSNIIMLDSNTYNAMLKLKDEALCMAKFYAHIIADNIDDVAIGDVLTNGVMELRVYKIGKHCHAQEGCGNFQDCPLMVKTYYLECLSEGNININERWEVIKCIVTP